MTATGMAEQTPSQIQLKLQDLSNSFDALESATGRLLEKIQSAVRPYPIEMPSNQAPAHVPRSTQIPVSERLEGIAEHINRLCSRIEAATENVEL